MNFDAFVNVCTFILCQMAFEYIFSSLMGAWYVVFKIKLLFQEEVFPYPEIGNEELEEIKQLVVPVEKFFNEEGGWETSWWLQKLSENC